MDHKIREYSVLSPPCTANVRRLDQYPFYVKRELSDAELKQSLKKQIEYYFSKDNLCKDRYLRMHMDGNGWVSIYLVAGFPKIVELTNRMQTVLDSLSSSDVVEVKCDEYGDRMRRRGDWEDWLWPVGFGESMLVYGLKDFRLQINPRRH